MEKNSFEKNVLAHNLYVNTPLLKALLKIIVPTLLMTFMTGIYLFSSQLIIATFVPKIFNNDWQNVFSKYGDLGVTGVDINKISIQTPADIVKSALSICSPIATIIGSSPFFLAGGASILFGRSLGAESRTKSNTIFKTSFWMVFILAIFETGILCAINEPILNRMAVLNTNHTAEQEWIHTLQVKWANEYTMVLSIGIILPLFLFYFASLIRAEGRFWVVVITNIICNILNLGFICFYIVVCKLDFIGGALGNTTSYLINIIVLIIYLSWLNKKNMTWLRWSIIVSKETKFNFVVISPIILIGLSSFLIDASYAVANMVYVPLLAHEASLYFVNAKNDTQYFQTIEGAIMPMLNLVFVTIYGIVEGERLLASYNYSRGNWKRIKKTYYLTIFISFVYATIFAILISFVVGPPILQYLFHINNTANRPTLDDAKKILIIQSFMLPIFSIQAAAMSIYMAIGDIVRSNISSILQDTITFFPVLGLMYLICSTLPTDDNHLRIWLLVSTYVINAAIATSVLYIYTWWWFKNIFGRTKYKFKTQDGKKHTLWVPTKTPGPSLVQIALMTI